MAKTGQTSEAREKVLTKKNIAWDVVNNRYVNFLKHGDVISYGVMGLTKHPKSLKVFGITSNK